VDELTHADLVAAANRMLPGRAPATLNRWVLRPAAAILHYAAENKYCEWLRVKLFEEPRPETRAARPATIAKLFDRTEGRQRLLVMWLYYQGTRITQTLSVDWPHVDLERAAFSFYDKKARRWQEFPLHADVLELLLLVPEAERVGRVFPWGDRHNVTGGCGRWFASLRSPSRRIWRGTPSAPGSMPTGPVCGRSWARSGIRIRGARCGIRPRKRR
jgi:integrase